MNQLKKWWSGGDIGTVGTNIEIDSKTLIKVSATVILVFLFIYVSVKLIKKKTS